MRKISQKGFTLIELMIVVAIIGILAAVAIPKFAQMMEKSREGATKGNIGAIKSAVTIYSGDWQGTWPSDIQQTTDPQGNATASWFASGGKGTYMDSIPAVKVSGKNANNPTGALTTVYNPGGKNVSGNPGGNQVIVSDWAGSYWGGASTIANIANEHLSLATLGANGAGSSQTTGWRYDSSTGQVFVNNNQLDSFGLSYTLFGYQ